MLNDTQKNGVTTSSQYTRIIAGAGSGKTRVLTSRIAYLLENGLAYASGILGITFTNKAAKEIKERVLKIVDGASDMALCTIHSWCARFLRFECYHINYPSNFIILDEDDAERVMKDIFVAHGKPKNDSNIKKCINWISSKKNQGFQYVDLKDEQYKNQELRDFLNYFEEYDRKLKEMYALDFDDLLLKTIEILKDKKNGVQEKYHNRISHILVDEFQDINDVQFELITLLLSPTCELYVVGDPDQTIYTWRGANNRIIIDLEKSIKQIYPEAKVETIILDKNYRSTKTILAAANKLIEHNNERIKKNLLATQDDGQKIALFKASRTSDEASYVANTIKELHQEGTNYKDIAILYRMNFLTRELESQLNLHQIPYKIYGGLKFYQRKEIKDVLAYLNLLINPMYNIGLTRIINVPKRNIGQSSLDKLLEQSETNGQSLYLYLLETDVDNIPLPLAKALSLKNMITIIEMYKDKIKNASSSVVPLIAKKMIDDLNYSKALEEDPLTVDERKDNVEEFFMAMQQYYNSVQNPTFEEFMEICALQSSQDDVESGDFVTLMTVHTAKGLEFDNVFLYSFCDGIFPSKRAIEESLKNIEEERRLAYVAITRAKKKLYVSYNEDFSHFVGFKLHPSRFIKEAGISKNIEEKYQYITQNEWSYYKPKKTFNKEPLVKKTNGITNWQINDRVKHDTFGYGSVIEVKKDLIVVKFDDEKYGQKTLVSSHFMIHKVLN